MLLTLKALFSFIFHSCLFADKTVVVKKFSDGSQKLFNFYTVLVICNNFELVTLSYARSFNIIFGPGAVLWAALGPARLLRSPRWSVGVLALEHDTACNIDKI